MTYKTLPEVLDKADNDVLIEKQGSKLVYAVKQSESSYILDDGHGGCYYVGKLAGSIALHPIWRKHTKVSRG